jgi:hypothetical protein
MVEACCHLLPHAAAAAGLDISAAADGTRYPDAIGFLDENYPDMNK